MNTTRLHSLAEQYLGRLDAAARVLSDEDREELLAEVRGHLEAGLPEDASDADAQNLLRDLGSPADIVAAAARESGQGPGLERPPAAPGDASGLPAGSWGLVEILAVLGLTVGTFLLPVIGPLVGVCLAWASPRWTRREKTVATVLTFLPLIALSLGAAVLMSSGPTRAVPDVPATHLIVGAAS